MQSRQTVMATQLSLLASDREKVAALMGKMVERELAAEQRMKLARRANRRPPSTARREQSYRKGSTDFVEPLRPRVFWKGADIIIVDKAIPDYQGSSTVVVSSEARHINRMLRALRDQSLKSVNWYSKLEFYGCIAERLNELDEPDLNNRVKVTETLFDGALNVLRLWETRLAGEE